jgi:prepilin-type processing-associated H-X9-DG protein
MKMGQVWSKASFDGTNERGHLGGHGSVLAVTAQNPGGDGRFGTDDDVLAPLNRAPVSVSMDANPGPDCHDSEDRIRGFYSFHSGGANFVFSDASVQFIAAEISPWTYRALSTISGSDSTSSDR